MDIQVLRTYVAVCEYGGFTTAAKKLGYSQSTVSAQIKQLEKELGATLFDRIRHNPTITDQGNVVLEYAREILMVHQKMMNSLHQPDQIEGEIHLAMANSICSRYFTDDFLDFHNKYPLISLKITSADTPQMFDLLRKNEADIVFTLDTHIYDSEFIICGESMEETHFVAAVGHPLSKKSSLELRDVMRYPFYLTEPGMSYRGLLDRNLAAASLEIHPVMETGNPDQICRLLKDSDAVSFLPDHVTGQYIKDGLLTYLPVTEFDGTVWNQILIHKNKWLSPAMQVLIDFYKEKIRQES